MALATRLSNVTAKAMATAVATQIDSGAGAGTVTLYSGTQAADPDTAIGAQVALAIFTLADPSFGTATDATPGGRITAEAVSATTGEEEAGAGTVATWFRAATSTGTAVIDGSVAGTGGTADLIIDNTTIADGQTVNLISWTITMPES